MAVSATQLNFEYSVLTHNQSTGAFQACPTLTVITLHDGQLTVNGQPISNPQFTTSQVNWTQQSTGAYSTGSLTVENGGMELNGVVSIGTTAQDAVSYDVWATAVPEITCRLSEFHLRFVPLFLVWTLG